ncbi:MAG: CDP-6-deoxy-delta-3,4-glucoseen reductase [Gammaproteobacteria bacterium]
MSYHIDVQPSGQGFDIEPGETVLDAGSRQGVVLHHGCKNGLCGSCKGRVLEGSVSYPDGIPKGLTTEEAEAGTHLFCKTVAESDLRIEANAVEAVADLEVRNFPVRVASLEKLSHDVMGVYLQMPKDQLLQFLPGQYIDVLIEDGKRRAFSIANAPNEHGMLELHIRHVPGGLFTDKVFATLKEKSILRIRAPLGTFYLRDDDRPLIMVGGGTGFAPIKGIIEGALTQGCSRPIHFFWGVRSKEDLYMPDLPAQWANQCSNILFTPVLSEPKDSDQWEGETGYVHESVVRQYPDLSGHAVYMGGPPVMIQACQNAFFEAGLPKDQIFYDSFDYAAATEVKV